MNDHDKELDDRDFDRLFARANTELHGAAFTPAVLRRLQRRALVRAAAVGIAATVGVALSFETLVDAERWSGALLRAGLHWNDLAWTDLYRAPIVALALATAGAALLRWL